MTYVLMPFAGRNGSGNCPVDVEFLPNALRSVTLEYAIRIGAGGDPDSTLVRCGPGQGSFQREVTVNGVVQDSTDDLSGWVLLGVVKIG